MNKKNIIILLFLTIIITLTFNSCNVKEEQKTLLETLNDLQGVTVAEIDVLPGYSQCFQIDITQPIDHNDPGGQTINQRFYLSHQGEKIIYLYGEIDPWTAGAIVPDSNLDSLMLIQPRANHSISIGNLDLRGLVIETLNRWLDTSINVNALKKTEYDKNRPRL